MNQCSSKKKKKESMQSTGRGGGGIEILKPCISTWVLDANILEINALWQCSGELL